MSGDLDRIIIGTWGLFDWSKLPDRLKAKETLETAIKLNFQSFDTSPVYGNGQAEFLLGGLNCEVHTKIPAVSRCAVSPQGAYPEDYFLESIQGSLSRTNRNRFNLVYIHNWNNDNNWNNLDAEVYFKNMFKRNSDTVEEWGVSLPSNYNLDLECNFDTILNLFSVIQIPYCKSRPENAKYIQRFLKYNKKVVLRSVLAHGLLIREDEYLQEKNPSFCKFSKSERDRLRESIKEKSSIDRIKECLSFSFQLGNVSVIIGVSNPSHCIELKRAYQSIC